MVFVCVAMVALAGCDDAKKNAESIGIIGGEDGPTPMGDSLSRRKYLGLIQPRGEFEKSGDCKDPYAGIIEPKWTAVGH